MLESLSIGLLSFFLQLFGHSPTPLQAMPLMDWQQEAIFAVPTQGDPVVEKLWLTICKNYPSRELILSFKASGFNLCGQN